MAHTVGSPQNGAEALMGYDAYRRCEAYLACTKVCHTYLYFMDAMTVEPQCQGNRACRKC